MNIESLFVIADGQRGEPSPNNKAWFQFPTKQFIAYTGDGLDVVDSTGTINTADGGLYDDTTTFDLCHILPEG